MEMMKTYNFIGDYKGPQIRPVAAPHLRNLSMRLLHNDPSITLFAIFS
jgi:hypothetical protein